MLVDYSSATTLPFHYAIHYVVGGQAPPEPIPWQVSQYALFSNSDTGLNLVL